MRILLPLLLFLPLNAFAEPIVYTINFVTISGVAPSGHFLYDTSQPRFSDFTVTTGQVVYDLTGAANTLSPSADLVNTIRGNPPCIAGLIRAAAAFQLLSGACPNDRWFIGTAASDISVMYFQSSDTEGNVISLGSWGPTFPGFAGGSGAQWAIADPPSQGDPINAPEPLSAVSLLCGVLISLLGISIQSKLQAKTAAYRIST